MTRISRTVSAAVLSTALLVSAASAAQPRTSARQHLAKPAVSWFDAALAWLGDLLIGPAQQRETQPSPVTKSNTYSTDPNGTGFGGAQTMCGSIIDPNGSCKPSGG